MLLLSFVPSAFSAIRYFDDFDADGAISLSDGALDQMRGGFVLENSNLKISLGIERAVSINGELVATTRLDIPTLSPEAAAQVVVATGALGTIVQNGPDNTVSNPDSLVDSPILFVQNTLDHQNIQTWTVINATVTSLNLQRSLAISSSINQALLNSLN